MSTPLITVIVPVYNTEKYLEECLDSIFNQTLKDIEVICVNDESPDNSLEILKSYHEKHNNMRIIDQPNSGLSAVRNNAIKFAKAPYIMYVDSDDAIDTRTCETAYKKIQEHNADVVVFSYSLLYNNTLHPRQELGEKERVFEADECRNFLYRRFFGLLSREMNIIERQDALNPVWTKIYKKDIILDNGIEFCDAKIIGPYEDGLFNLQYFNFCKKAVYLPDCLYIYRRDNPNSITTKYKEKLPEQRRNLLALIKNEIDKNNLGENFKEALSNKTATSVIGLGFNAIAKKCSIFGHVSMLYKILCESENKKAIKKMSYKNMPVHWKVFFKCCRYKLSLFVVLLLYAMNYLRRIR